MRELLKHIYILIPALLLVSIVLIIPQINNSELMLPTQSGKVFGLLAGISGYFLITLFIAAVNRQMVTLQITIVDLLLGTYCLMVLLSYWLHPVDQLQMLSFVALLIFYLGVRLLNTEYQLLLLIAVAVSGTIQAVYGNLQLWGYYPSHHGLFRMTGSFFNPGPYAGYLAAVLPVAIGLYFKSLNVRKFKDLNVRMFDRFSNNDLSNSSYPSNPSNSIALTLLNAVALVSIILIVLVLPASRSRAAWLGAIAGCLYIFQTFKLFSTLQTSFFKPFKPFNRALIVAGILFFMIALIGMYKFKQGSADGRLLI